MAWKFRLTLQYENDDNETFDVKGYDELLADNFVKLLSQFIILVATVQRKIAEEEAQARMAGRFIDDDIPF